jgi:hypothetical protein
MLAKVYAFADTYEKIMNIAMQKAIDGPEEYY